ncbi:MAG TPA: MBL fold metallo-hydrolase [Candidatus Polarisedimenticolia bacterium]|jgi:glyoxylase-like metal-dependent hydrolase (beta-lactamase superfamily II)|nr:MBL fold metallo-hydrolase [Candidatus Polarisedimenticolia bacterium]
MILERVEHPRWLSNTWIAAAADGGAGVLVDAGGPAAPVLDVVRQKRLRITHILLTHHHGDHVAEREALAAATGAKVLAHPLEAVRLGGVDREVGDRDTIEAGPLHIEVMHIPGHTDGQTAWLLSLEGACAPAVCFTGDTLFRGAIGSTTAPGHTDFRDLRRSLVERLLALPDEVRVAPGHSEPTSIGAERAGNPFLRVLLGADAEGTGAGRFDGVDVRVIVEARDYDGGTKAWIRFPDGRDATIPGSRLSARRSRADRA